MKIYKNKNNSVVLELEDDVDEKRKYDGLKITTDRSLYIRKRGENNFEKVEDYKVPKKLKEDNKKVFLIKIYDKSRGE